MRFAGTWRRALFFVLVVAGSGAVAAQAPVPVWEDALAQALELDLKPGDERDSAAAALLYAQAAEMGSMQARYRLGMLAEMGDGVDQDYFQARRCYEIAAAAGMPEAYLRLAICHFEGWGGPISRPDFVRDVRIAAEADYTPAMIVLAQLFGTGLGIEQDLAASKRWYERAALFGSVEGQYSMGLKTEAKGKSFRDEDMALARTWYQLSAEAEYHAAMRAMARNLANDSNIENGKELAEEWLQLAIKAGDNEAPFNLAWLLARAPSPLPHESNRILQLLELASSRGNYRAHEVLYQRPKFATWMEAFRYVLSTPQVERYVRQQAETMDRLGTVLDSPPKVIWMVNPIYPVSLQVLGTEGRAAIGFVVDTTGRVREVKVVEATHPLFAERARESVAQWRFEPGRKNGRLVNTRMQVPVIFNIGEETVADIDMAITEFQGVAVRLGADAARDAATLQFPKKWPKMRRPRMPDGSAPPSGASAWVMVVVDIEGNPLRSYVLRESHPRLGAALAEIAMNSRFEPVIAGDTPIEAALLVPFGVPEISK